MDVNCTTRDTYEISPRFRTLIEERVVRLEQDADSDEAQVRNLIDEDHIRRHYRLVDAQRAEAQRMRHFLDRARTRLADPSPGVV